MNNRKTHVLIALSALALATAGCAPRGAVQPVERAKPAPAYVPAERPDEVATTIVGGTAPQPVLPPKDGAGPAAGRQSPKGAIEFNIPSADVKTLARIVLRDTLRIPYVVAIENDVDVSLTTPGPVSRAQLLDLFEAALKKADLAMVWEGSGYRITTVADAKAAGTGFLPDRGFGTETVILQFANAGELKKLLDTVVPGAVQSVDEGRNALVIAGTTTQRKSVHEVIDQFDVNWLRSMSFALFVPNNVDSRLIVPELDKLINAPDAPTKGLVRLIGMEKLNGVIAISAQKQYLEDVRRWVEVLDREGTSAEPRLFVYRVQNGRAKDLVKTINSSFGIGGGDLGSSGAAADSFDDPRANVDPNSAPRQQPPAPGTPAVKPAAGDTSGQGGGSGLRARVSVDEVNNAVVVYGSPHDYSVIEDALRKLDIPPIQVMIEAAITEVGLNDEMQYGVQWNFAPGRTNFTLSTADNGKVAQTFPGFSFFYSNNNDISAALNALEARTTVKVVSAPKLMVLNNQTAALQVGDQVPVLTQQVTPINGNGNLNTANSIEYRDTGVILKITPRVNAGGSVLLDVSQEVSDVAKTKTGVDSSPTISTRRISTTVSVQDGQVIALGGLFRDSRTFGKSGIPFLSRIPVVGALFGTNDDTTKRTELLILIKPHVLRSPEDMSAVTEELRQKIKTIEPFKTKGRIP